MGQKPAEKKMLFYAFVCWRSIIFAPDIDQKITTKLRNYYERANVQL